jgi:hypothetical protein
MEQVGLGYRRRPVSSLMKKTANRVQPARYASDRIDLELKERFLSKDYRQMNNSCIQAVVAPFLAAKWICSFTTE